LTASGPEFELLDKDIHSSHKTTSLNLFHCCFCFCFLFSSLAYFPLGNTASVLFGFRICLYINLDLLCFIIADRPLFRIASLLVASELLGRSLNGFDHSTAAGSGTSASVFFRMHLGQHLQGLFTSSLLCTFTHMLFFLLIFPYFLCLSFPFSGSKIRGTTQQCTWGSAVTETESLPFSFPVFFSLAGGHGHF
jgi:hypothetical protein